MLFLGLGLLLVLGCFSFVLLFGAPYLPTLSRQIGLALDVAKLQPGDTLLELGCGDGAVLLAAARRGYKVIGYELNPLLVIVCRLRTWRYRKQVRIRMQNFWTADWPPAEAVFVFALQRYMARLDMKLLAYPHKPVRLVSFAFTIPARKPDQSEAGLFIYDYRV